MEEFGDLGGWLEALKGSGCPIIVEGKRDRASLLDIGIRAEIIELSNKALFQVVEEVAGKAKKVVILTDLDKEGKRLYSILRRGLLERGVHVDNVFREWLFKNTKLRQIEGFHKYLLKHE
jgi:5S rRNA maturation endonuclease (ribonuclease M5)